MLALTPFVFVDQAPAVNPLLYVQYGFSDRFELLAGAGATVGTPSSFDGIELMPRLFLSDESAAVLHMTWVPGDDPVIAPEYHGIYDMDALQLTVNVGWGPSVGRGGFDAGSVYALVAPERYLTDSTSVFLELNPRYVLSTGAGPASQRFAFEVVPGLSTDIADTHYFCVGVGVPLLPDFDVAGVYLGAWYSVAFGGA